jgi:hypothetical protein
MAVVTSSIVPQAGAGTVAGTVSFECTATLPNYPTWAGSGTCGSRALPATAAVSAAGIDGATNAPFVVTGTGRFTASFDYNELCLPEAVVGLATGTATVTGLSAVYGGAPATATLDVTFTWMRVGATADIHVLGYRLTIIGGHTIDGSLGEGAATFAPLLGQDNRCPVGGPLDALVHGDVAFAT